MFRIGSQKLVLSVGDLVRSSRCEYALLCDLDVELGRRIRDSQFTVDSSWRRMAAQAGRQHERDVLRGYRGQFGRSAVVEIPRPEGMTEAALEAAAAQTLAALRGGARVIHQAVVFDGEILGYADFLHHGEDGRWQVEDTKLAVAASFEAQFQVAAYASLLGAAGVRLADAAVLALGDGSRHDVRLDDVVPSFHAARDRVLQLVRDHRRSGLVAQFSDSAYRACGECARCRSAIEQQRDILQVAGVRAAERAALVAGGIRTVEDLATATTAVAGIPGETFAQLRGQAALQCRPGQLPGAPAFDVVRARELGLLPVPDEGDLFLSFAAQGRPEEDDEEPDHLFGVDTAAGDHDSFWADDAAGEAEEFLRFLAVLDRRRASHPGMHVYHYSRLDRPHLYDLAQRAGAGESAVDALIADGVLVDLYSVVAGALRVGTRDLSLREVARLVDPEAAQLLSGAGVRAERAEHRRLLAQADVVAAAQLRSRLERENRDRCVLTGRLRDWLLTVAAQEGVAIGQTRRRMRSRTRVDHEGQQWIDALFSTEAAARSEVAAAALRYHEREAAVFWRAHFARLQRPTAHWSPRVRGALRIDLVRVDEDWAPGPRGGVARTLRVQTTPAPGTVLQEQAQPFLVYDGAPPFEAAGARPGARTATDAVVLEQTGEHEYRVRERLPRGATPWTARPAALAPDRPPRTTAIEAAVRAWASNLITEDERTCAATALVDRAEPRTTGDGLLRVFRPDGGLDARVSLVGSIERLDGSYLAVQGPPGSGKTTVGSQAIADLVARGWRIGVVAQSHAVVEHFLERVVAAGAPADRVAKHVRTPAPVRFTAIRRTAYRSFMRDHQDGFVIGGTAWDLTNAERMPAGSLDLLVIDEAGQFGLVNTIAVAQAARNLLLLGDPQQLPQVSQAAHRAQVDRSALGWLLDGAAVLPKRHGFFLDRTWRMHPALTRAVSDLSYDRALTAHAVAGERTLESIAPGLHLRSRRHLGSTDASREEADEVVRIAQEVVGRPWREAAGADPRPLTERDVIVVAPYNAQVECIRDALTAAGLSQVEVGTVDRFQGREAAIAVYSTTVSSLAARPQAARFVLGRNRLNVAISRAKWAAYIVHSAQLTNHVVRNAEDAAALSRFLRLCEYAASGLRCDGGRSAA